MTSNATTRVTVWARPLFAVLVMLLALTSVGCISLPTDYYGSVENRAWIKTPPPPLVRDELTGFRRGFYILMAPRDVVDLAARVAMLPSYPYIKGVLEKDAVASGDAEPSGPERTTPIKGPVGIIMSWKTNFWECLGAPLYVWGIGVATVDASLTFTLTRDGWLRGVNSVLVPWRNELRLFPNVRCIPLQ